MDPVDPKRHIIDEIAYDLETYKLVTMISWSERNHDPRSHKDTTDSCPFSTTCY